MRAGWVAAGVAWAAAGFTAWAARRAHDYARLATREAHAAAELAERADAAAERAHVQAAERVDVLTELPAGPPQVTNAALDRARRRNGRGWQT
jgi:hypothetical protein